MDPKTGSDQRIVFPHFLTFQRAFNALRPGQECWSKRSRVTSLTTPLLSQLAPSSQRAQFARVWLAAAIKVIAEQKNHRHGQTRRLNPFDLLAETIFGKRTGLEKHHLAGLHFGVQKLVSKVEVLTRRKVFTAPVLESEIWTPKRSPTNAFSPTFLAFQRASSTLSDEAKHVGRNVRTLPSLTTSLLRQTCAPPSERAQFARVCLTAAVRMMAEITSAAKHVDEPV